MERMAQIASDPTVEALPTANIDAQSLTSTMPSNNPLKRKILVNIRASLSDLITQPTSVSTRTPTENQLGSMLKQRIVLIGLI